MDDKKIRSMGLELISLKDSSYDIKDVSYEIPNNSKYVILYTNLLTRLFPLLNSIVSYGSSWKFSMGIVILPLDNYKCKIIHEGIEYFETTVNAINNMEKEDMFYIDLLFINKLKGALPRKLLLYSQSIDNSINYYLRTIKGDININFLSSMYPNELRQSIKLNKSITLDAKTEFNKLSKAYRFLSNLSQVDTPSISFSNRRAVHNSGFVSIEFNSYLPDLSLNKNDLYKIINYIKIVGLESKIKVSYLIKQVYTHLSLECNNTTLALFTKNSMNTYRKYSKDLTKICSFKVNSKFREYISFMSKLTTIKSYFQIDISGNKMTILAQINNIKHSEEFNNIIDNQFNVSFRCTVNLITFYKILKYLDENVFITIYNNVIMLEDNEIKINLLI